MGYEADLTKYISAPSNPDPEGWLTYIDKNCHEYLACKRQFRISKGTEYEGIIQVEDPKLSRLGGGIYKN